MTNRSPNVAHCDSGYAFLKLEEQQNCRQLGGLLSSPVEQNPDPSSPSSMNTFRGHTHPGRAIVCDIRIRGQEIENQATPSQHCYFHCN